jgi:hypothetical protein
MPQSATLALSRTPSTKRSPTTSPRRTFDLQVGGKILSGCRPNHRSPWFTGFGGRVNLSQSRDETDAGTLDRVAALRHRFVSLHLVPPERRTRSLRRAQQRWAEMDAAEPQRTLGETRGSRDADARSLAGTGTERRRRAGPPRTWAANSSSATPVPRT